MNFALKMLISIQTSRRLWIEPAVGRPDGLYSKMRVFVI